MSAPPKQIETETILEAYREERQRRAAGEPTSPHARLAEALDLIAASEEAAAESREAFRRSHPQGARTRNPEEKLLSHRILLIVEIAARAGHDEALVSRLVAMETASRVEEGCLEYTMLRALTDPLRFVVYEIWQSAEHLENHRRTPHYLAFGPAIGELVAGSLRLLEVPLPA